MTREELDQLLDAAKGDSDSVEIAASKIAEALNSGEGSEPTDQELKRAVIELVWIATSSKRMRVMLIRAIFGQPKRRPGNPGKSEERQSAISMDAYRMRLGYEPASARRLARHIGVSRPTISDWRNDPDYQKDVYEDALKESIEIIGILRLKKTNVK